MELPKPYPRDPIDELADKRNISYEAAAELSGHPLKVESSESLELPEQSPHLISSERFSGDDSEAPADDHEIAVGLPGYFIDDIPYATLETIATRLRDSKQLSASSKKKGIPTKRKKSLAGESIVLRVESDQAIRPLVVDDDSVVIARFFLREVFGENNRPQAA